MCWGGGFDGEVVGAVTVGNDLAGNKPILLWRRVVCGEHGGRRVGAVYECMAGWGDISVYGECRNGEQWGNIAFGDRRDGGAKWRDGAQHRAAGSFWLCLSWVQDIDCWKA